MWPLWRLVLDGGMRFEEVFHDMTPAQVDEANAALDYYIELRNRRKG